MLYKKSPHYLNTKFTQKVTKYRRFYTFSKFRLFLYDVSDASSAS